MNAATKPDASQFLKNERPNEYEAVFKVEGEIRVTIKAESLEDARAKAQTLAEDDMFGEQLDNVEDVEISSVRKSVPMFLVSRNGKPMQTSYLTAGDLPREPTETGF